MPTAKEKFLNSSFAAKHKAWAETVEAEAATDYALLALVEEQPSSPDVFAHAQIVGARRYRELLLTIHKPQTEIKKGGLLGPNLKPPS